MHTPLLVQRIIIKLPIRIIIDSVNVSPDVSITKHDFKDIEKITLPWAMSFTIDLHQQNTTLLVIHQ